MLLYNRWAWYYPVIDPIKLATHQHSTTLNHKHGAADIYYSNGQPARITNPKNLPFLCKHLVALYLKIANKLPKT